MSFEDYMYEKMDEKLHEIAIDIKKANRLVLPDDEKEIAAMLESRRKLIFKVSDESPHKDRHLFRVEMALKALKNGDMQTVKLMFRRIDEGLNLEWEYARELGLQKQFGKDKEGLRKFHEEKTHPEWQKWRDEAERIRQQSSRKMSKRELAQRIKKNLDVSKSTDWISRKL